MSEQVDLIEKVCAYDPSADQSMLERAYTFSMNAHGSQLRQSGDLYFTHPVRVASILSEMKLDAATIITALLHDTVEDTLTTLDEIEKNFGSEIARLVDGVTKLSLLELPTISDRGRRAENFRKLFLAMSDDIRILLVKLADRLHNMQTLQHFDNLTKQSKFPSDIINRYIEIKNPQKTKEEQAQ